MKHSQVDVVPDSIVVELTGMQSLEDVEAVAISIRFENGCGRTILVMLVCSTQ